MIKVVAKNYIKADKLSEFLTIAKQLVKDTNEKDAGCIRYELFQDTSDSKILTIIEEWDDMKSIRNSMRLSVKGQRFISATDYLPAGSAMELLSSMKVK